MSNIIRDIRVLGIVCIFGVMLQSNCYADYTTTIDEIIVKCSPTPEEAQSQIYPGEPNTYLELATKGIKIDGREEIAMSHDGKFNSWYVRVACIALDRENGGVWRPQVKDALLFPEHPLKCEKGQGIEITMFEPNDTNPNRYQYVANLKTIREIKKHVRKSRSIISSPPPVNTNILDIDTSAITNVRS